MTSSCTFCCSPASPQTSEQIDVISIKFLFHYFQIPFKYQIGPDGCHSPIFPSCSECAYLFREIQRLSSIWVEIQIHLFDNIVPEIVRRFEAKDVQQKLGKTVGDRNLRDSSVSVTFRQEVMKLIGSIPDAVDVKRKAMRVGQLLPVEVTKQIGGGISKCHSLPEIQIESQEWSMRHGFDENCTMDVVTLVVANPDEVSSMASSTPKHPNLYNRSPVANQVFAEAEDHRRVEVEEGADISDNSFPPQPDENDSDESFEPPGRKPRQRTKKPRVVKPKPSGETTQITADSDSGDNSPPKKKRIRKPCIRTPRTKVPSEPRKQIQCKFCPLVVFYPHTYRKHEQRIHKNLLHHKCSQCVEIFSSDQYLQAHSEIHLPDLTEWKCRICNLSCSRPDRLRRHIQEVHIPDYIESSSVLKNNHANTTLEDMKCPICSSQFSSRKKFTKHMNLIHYKPFKHCDYCPNDETAFKTKDPLHMVAHLYKSHPDLPKNLSCDFQNCGKLFAYKFVKERHLEYHKLEDLKHLSCIYCEMRFSNDEDDARVKHESTCIEVSEPADEKCSRCDKVFPGGRDLVRARHEQAYHPELLIHNCSDCDRKFLRKSFLEAHLVTHSIGPFQCTICPSLLASGDELNSHLAENHTGESFIKCKEPNCNAVFSHRTMLDYHTSKCHAGRKFVCQICSREFNKHDHLKIHMERLHPEDCPVPPRQFQCHMCSKFFVRQTILNSHVRVAHENKRRPKKTCTICAKSICSRLFKEHVMSYHKGEKSHLCSVCGKSFIWENSYRQHIRTHSAVKPHSCGDCSKTFTELRKLKRHSQTQHPRDVEGNLIAKPPRKNKAKTVPNKKKKKSKTAKEDEDTDEEVFEMMLSDSEPESDTVVLIKEENAEDGESENAHNQVVGEDEDQAISNLLLSHAKRRRSPRSSPPKKSRVPATPDKSTPKKDGKSVTKKSKGGLDKGTKFENDPDFQPRLISVQSLQNTEKSTREVKIILENCEKSSKNHHGDDGASIRNTPTNAPTRKSMRNRKPIIKH